MKLSAILSGADGLTGGYRDTEITSVENDSRLCKEGSLFIAASGYVDDAHPYIGAAYEKGCRAFLISADRLGEYAGRFPGAQFVGAGDIKSALAEAACGFYGNPSMKMFLIGITGTSGKTTTAFAVFTALRKMGLHAGLVGTIEYRIDDETIEATNTTPDLLFLNKLMSEMAGKGVQFLVMEVSSHSLQLDRVKGLNFDVAAFTNFSQDHLDFHRTMEEYFSAKLLIFDLLDRSGKKAKTAVVNRETDGFVKIKEYASRFPAIRLKTISLEDRSADYYADIFELSAERTAFTLRGADLVIGMPGRTNVYNFTLASAILSEAGFDINSFGPLLDGVSVRGRLEKVPAAPGVTVVVDYAHKPDALEKVLRTLRPLVRDGGRLVAVFGAGGDRDRTKRPIMGRIAGELSDLVVITSDNPRTEDPSRIIREIEAGVKETGREYAVEANRAAAIRRVLEQASEGDVILIAGKGHEDYQIVGKAKSHFSDREEVLKFYGRAAL